MARRERIRRRTPRFRAPHAVSDHAVRRYCQRHASGLTADEARAYLTEACRLALLHEADGVDQTIWRTPRGELLVVSLDGCVRTVLPAGARAPNRRPRRRAARRR